MRQGAISLTSANRSLTLLVYIMVTLIGLVISVAIVVIDPLAGLLPIIMLLGLAIVARKELLLYVTMFIALLVAGLAQLYFPPLSFVRWIVPITSTLLLIHLIPFKLGERDVSRSMPWLLRWALIYFVVTIFSSLINWRGSIEFMQGVKLYFQLWGLLFGLTLISWRPSVLDGVLKALLLLAVIQLPFVLHQYVFIVPAREGLWQLGVVPLDVVAGTMGANYFGSGQNVVLSFFLVSTFGVLAALWREKVVRYWLFLIATPFLLVPLFLNESKFAVVILLVVLAFVFRKDIYQKPFRFILISVVTTLLVIGLLVSYSMSFGKGRTLAETVEFTIESNVGSRGYAGMVLNRWTVLSFWESKHGLDNLPETLVGHGLGASHESTQSALVSSTNTLADTLYRGYGIGLTSVSSILWDAGLIGIASLLFMFVSAYLGAWRLSRLNVSNPWHRGVFEGLQAVIMAAGLMLFHSNYFVLDPAFQSLIYFVFGYIGFWAVRNTNRSASRQ